jgi:hypothetical protein
VSGTSLWKFIEPLKLFRVFAWHSLFCHVLDFIATAQGMVVMVSVFSSLCRCFFCIAGWSFAPSCGFGPHLPAALSH